MMRVSLVVLSVASIAVASGGGGEAHGPDKAFIFAVVNFVIFAFLLVKFAKPALANYFGSKQAELEKVVEEVKAERAALAEEQATLEAALKDVRDGREERLRLAEQAAIEEANEIVDEAKTQAESILADAKARAEGIVKSGQDTAVKAFVDEMIGEMENRYRESVPTTVDAAMSDRVQNSLGASS